jgi:hypothetical protein
MPHQVAIAGRPEHNQRIGIQKWHAAETPDDRRIPQKLNGARVSASTIDVQVVTTTPPQTSHRTTTWWPASEYHAVPLLLL